MGGGGRDVERGFGGSGAPLTGFAGEISTSSKGAAVEPHVSLATARADEQRSRRRIMEIVRKVDAQARQIETIASKLGGANDGKALRAELTAQISLGTDCCKRRQR